MTRIIIDDKIPYVKGVFEEIGCEVAYIPGEKTTASDVANADAIMTRTRTNCSAELLRSSNVKVIASATIGFDHIDTAYCEKNGIAWFNAAGCNATGVQQYIACALTALAAKKKVSLKGKTLAVIGVGHTGKLTAEIGHLLEMNVILNDPLRAMKEPHIKFSTMDDVYEQADVVSLHVPLTQSGGFPTFHCANHDFFSKFKNKIFFINASRGEVTETQALINAITSGIISGSVIDVWENEPHISHELLNIVDIATPHIAGYSVEGKQNGTQIAVRAISSVLNLGIDDFKPAPLEDVIQYEPKSEDNLADFFAFTYNILEEDKRMRDCFPRFEQLRNRFRRDFTAYTYWKKMRSRPN